MITSQVVIFFIAAIARMIQQHMANSREIEMKQLEYIANRDKLETEQRHSIRELIASNSLFGWTTSILAIFAFVFVVAVPMIAPFYGMSIHLGYIELKEAWSFLFFGGVGGEDMMFQVLPGLTLLPFHFDLISAIAGLYFGGLRGRRSP